MSSTNSDARVSSCPDRARWARFAIGSLVPDEVERMAEHLEGCPQCRIALEGLARESDTLLMGLARAGDSGSYAEEASCQEVLAELEELGHRGVVAASSEPRQPDTVAIPDRIGPYQVGEQLGEGGMGTVYRAVDTRLNRVVALKMIRADKSVRSDAIERFQNEARVAARLDHPHIVSIYEVGRADGVHYLAMKLVDGSNLESRLQDFVPDPRAAARLVMQVAEAIHYAHQRGVLHRDLKPSNILLDAQSHPYVSDLGLAKRFDLDSSRTRSGVIMGTPSYMSPEQAMGHGAEVTTAADVYGLGAILYALLTGQPPFDAPTPWDTCRLVAEREPDPPRAIDQRVDRDLETICLKCLRKDPTRRYDSAAMLAEDLQRWLRGEPIRARRTKVAERLWRWCRRRPALGATLVLAALLLLIVSIGSPLAAYWWRQERNRAVAAERTAQQRERETKWALFDAYLSQAEASRTSGRPGCRFDGLTAVAKAAKLADTLPLGEERVLRLRNHAIACMVLPDMRPGAAWPIPFSESLDVPNVFFDSRLAQYSCCDAEGNISVFSIGGDAGPVRLKGFGGVAGYQRFSPDGRLLAVNYSQSGRWSFCLYSLRDGEVLVKTPLDVHFSALCFSSDSRLLAVGETNGTIHFYDTATGSETQQLPTGQTGAFICFTPDDSRLTVCSGGSGDVRLFNVQDGSLAEEYLLQAQVTCLSWHPERPLLAAACTDHQVRIWDATKKEIVQTLVGHTAAVVSVTYHPDGDVLVSQSWDGTTRLWDPAQGVEILRIDGAFRGFRADGRQIALLRTEHGKASASTWHVARSREFRRVNPAAPLRGIAIDASGRLMASADDDGIRLWDLTTTRQLDRLPGANCCAAWFHPDGRGLIAGGTDGLWLWPTDQTKDGELSIGPAQRLCPPLYATTHASFSSSGRFVAFTSGGSHVLLRDLEMGTSLARGGHHNLHTVAISPQGKWMAAYPGPGIKIWNGSTGKLETTLLPGKASGWNRLVFSPDGNWLVSGRTNEYRFWHVGDWTLRYRVGRQGHPIGGPIAFTRDGRLAVIASSRYEAKLIDPAVGKELATLEAPGPLPDITDFCFSPDGSRLVTSGTNRVLHVWDLRRIRRRLAEMNLDWDPPADLGELRASERSPLRVKRVSRTGNAQPSNGAELPVAGSGQAGAGDATSLMDQLQHDDWRERLRAANTLATLGGSESTIALLTARLRDPTVTDAERCRICRVLAEIGSIDTHTQAVLSDLMKSADCDVRAWAAAALARADSYLSDGEPQLAEPSDDREQSLRMSIASAWNGRAWTTVAKSGRPAAEYDRAVRLGHAIRQLLPVNGVVLNTLGVALYRAGQWEESRATLIRSYELDVERFGGPVPSDVAFLAMVHERLGEAAKSKSYFQQLVILAHSQPWSQDPETQGFLREAKALLKTDSTKPHAP